MVSPNECIHSEQGWWNNNWFEHQTLAVLTPWCTPWATEDNTIFHPWHSVPFIWPGTGWCAGSRPPAGCTQTSCRSSPWCGSACPTCRQSRARRWGSSLAAGWPGGSCRWRSSSPAPGTWSWLWEGRGKEERREEEIKISRGSEEIQMLSSVWSKICWKNGITSSAKENVLHDIPNN